MADTSTTDRQILDVIKGDCWARCQLRNSIGYTSVASIPRKSRSSVDTIPIVLALVIFVSTVDDSTNGARILIPFAGGCLARLELYNSLRYISVALKLSISLSSVPSVLDFKLVIFYSIADYSTAA